MGFYEWVGVLRKALRLPGVGWGGGGRTGQDTPQVRPCRLGRGIHAADGPAPPGPRCLPITLRARWVGSWKQEQKQCGPTVRTHQSRRHHSSGALLPKP
ncbi:hypothetical protein SMG44B_80133 [Stenotrophomonas maltophilia]